MVQLGHNQVQVLKSGTFYYESSSLLIPSLSASAEAQKLAITCSADSGNNLATTSSLSGYFTIPLISASSTLISPIINVINIYFVFKYPYYYSLMINISLLFKFIFKLKV